jgi:ketosteroid isomerase-like protein
MLRSILFLFLVSVVLACQQQTLSKDEMKSIVNAGNDRLGYLFKKGDADSLALMYTSEAQLSLNGYDFATGRDAIHQLWKEDMISSKVLEMNTQTLTVEGTKDVIYETGKTFLKLTYKDSTFTTSVKYCNIWRLQADGSYKLAVDFSNSDKH